MVWACLNTAGSGYAATINFNASIGDGTVLKGISGSNLNGEVRFGVFWNQNVATPSFLNEAAVGSIWSTTPLGQRLTALQSRFLSLISSDILVTNGSFSFSGTANNEYDTRIDDGEGGTLLVPMRDAPIFAFVVDSFTSPTQLAVLSATFSTVGDENNFFEGRTTWSLAFNSVQDDEWGSTVATANTVIGTTTGTPISSVQLVALSGGGGAVITLTGTLVPLSTTYGTSSSVQSINISGTGLTENITATAPTGVEVSSDGTTYGSTATFLRSGGSVSGSLRVRLAAAAPVSGSYDSQNIVLSSFGASNVIVTTAASGNSVAAKGLTISGLTAANKDFDGTTVATVSGTPTFVGLANGENFSVSGPVTWSFPDSTVGDNKTLSQTGSYSAPSGNYSVTQPILTASIRALPTLRLLTIGTPVFADGKTTVTHTFAGNSNATYQFEFKSSLTEDWQTHPVVVNAGNNFSVTFTNTGINSTNEWKNKMFFRVKNS